MAEERNVFDAVGDHSDGRYERIANLFDRVGQNKAFKLISKQSKLADVLLSKQIKESKHYKELGYTWDDFCPKFLGDTRRWVDERISRLDEFKEEYFKVAELVGNVSPGVYRRLRIEGEQIEVGGELVAITAKNRTLV